MATRKKRKNPCKYTLYRVSDGGKVTKVGSLTTTKTLFDWEAKRRILSRTGKKASRKDDYEVEVFCYGTDDPRGIGGARRRRRRR